MKLLYGRSPPPSAVTSPAASRPGSPAPPRDLLNDLGGPALGFSVVDGPAFLGSVPDGEVRWTTSFRRLYGPLTQLKVTNLAVFDFAPVDGGIIVTIQKLIDPDTSEWQHAEVAQRDFLALAEKHGVEVALAGMLSRTRFELAEDRAKLALNGAWGTRAPTKFGGRDVRIEAAPTLDEEKGVKIAWTTSGGPLAAAAALTSVLADATPASGDVAGLLALERVEAGRLRERLAKMGEDFKAAAEYTEQLEVEHQTALKNRCFFEEHHRAEGEVQGGA